MGLSLIRVGGFGRANGFGLTLPPLFAGMHKSLMHNRQIRVTAGKYQGKSFQLWRAIGVVDY